MKFPKILNNINLLFICPKYNIYLKADTNTSDCNTF